MLGELPPFPLPHEPTGVGYQTEPDWAFGEVSVERPELAALADELAGRCTEASAEWATMAEVRFGKDGQDVKLPSEVERFDGVQKASRGRWAGDLGDDS